MATEILVKTGTPVVFADTTDFSSTNNGFTRTHQLDLTSIANGAARQSDKADLGATRPAKYAVRVAIEMDVAPTAANEVDFYWSASHSGTAGTGNDGGASGADAAYKAGEEAEWVRQLIPMGSLVLTNDAATTVQYQTINSNFVPPQRYGSVIVYNRSGQAFEGDAVEMYVALVPITDEFQNA
jgi:hypothetical protein